MVVGIPHLFARGISNEAVHITLFWNTGNSAFIQCTWLWNVFAMIFRDQEYRDPILEKVLFQEHDLAISSKELGPGTFTVWAYATEVPVSDGTVQSVGLSISIGNELHKVDARSIVYGEVINCKVFSFSQTLWDVKIDSHEIQFSLDPDSSLSGLTIKFYRAH